MSMTTRSALEFIRCSLSSSVLSNL